MTKTSFRSAIEIALLFAALFILFPYIPSHEGVQHEPWPKAAFAVAAFGGSRFLRWQRNVVPPLVETAVFAIFAWALIGSYNLL